MRTIETYYQPDSKDCGPTCLRAIAKYYGKTFSMQTLRDRCYITREGVTMLNLADAAASIGMRTLSAKITLAQLAESMPLPCILFWNHNHFVVCHDVKGKKGNWTFHIMDPGQGKISYSVKEMKKYWLSGKVDGEDIGIAMQIEPGENFNDMEDEKEESKAKSMSYFLKFLLPHKRTYLYLLIGSLIIMAMNYCLPFLSQSTVDIGIKNRDLHFILLIMVIQLVIAVSQTIIQFMQSWISLHMHTLIDLSLVESYLDKLTRMPMRFFEIKTMGDILQRIGDHGRIKGFLMNYLVGGVFAISTFVVFTIILAIYNWKILTIFLTGNVIHILWILAFLKYRRKIDNKMFQQSAKMQNNMVQFIEGMPEIKMNNIEYLKLWEWKHIQAEIYKISILGLRIGQIQSSGSMLISTATSILISYITAKLVVDGSMTLGMMMSLSFIIGQVAGPISYFVGFIVNYQDAKISLDRLNDVNSQEDEMSNYDKKLSQLPLKRDIDFQHVSFSYDGSSRNYALDDVTLHIPVNSVTAIVGASGSGKTTLLKMILGFYKPLKGRLTIGDMDIQSIQPKLWRKFVGAVMQDGYIFSDTIAKNVAVCHEEDIDKDKLLDVIKKVNLLDYVYSQPLNFSTQLGNEGIGLSQGQKQRVLLARAMYKNPDYLILDEATNALDSNNEHLIMDNLREFCKSKTVIVAAHRMSTVKDADNIVVLDKGKIVEQGSHQQLIALKGYYYNLVKDQLSIEE